MGNNIFYLLMKRLFGDISKYPNSGIGTIYKVVLISNIMSLSIFVKSQSETWRYYSQKDYLCSTSLRLYTDSTYVFESGCEGRSNVNFGEWKINKKIVTLTPFDTTRIDSFYEVTCYELNGKDSVCRVHIVDAYGQPINNFRMVVIPKGYTDYIFEKQNGGVLFIPFSGIDYEFISTNNNGDVLITYNMDSEIVLLSLWQLFHAKISIPFGDRPSQINIKIDTHYSVFDYSSINWLNLSSNIINVKKKKFKFIVD